MKIKEELNKLHETDIWSLMLFALYKIKDIPEYSSISQLAYILDKENMLKLCEYFGGLTIKIPTIKELETMLQSLVLYQYINIEGKDFDEALALVDCRAQDIKELRTSYFTISELLENYNFNGGK